MTDLNFLLTYAESKDVYEVKIINKEGKCFSSKLILEEIT